MLHELATNATKYGALSAPAGSVSLTWRVDNNKKPPHLHVNWRETGGPPVTPPTRSGFGSRLIKLTGLAVEQNFAPTGFVCDLEIALIATSTLE